MLIVNNNNKKFSLVLDNGYVSIGINKSLKIGPTFNKISVKIEISIPISREIKEMISLTFSWTSFHFLSFAYRGWVGYLWS